MILYNYVNCLHVIIVLGFLIGDQLVRYRNIEVVPKCGQPEAFNNISINYEQSTSLIYVE